MIPQKRLQVFISSTYLDLQEERQAAVEAVLESGHIPAGMELFSAGDASQLELIKQWIDESDVYMLILGGRYGTIDKASGKSYTHLEYEYAIEKEKPYFAIVISETGLDRKVEKLGRKATENDDTKAFGAFKELVTSKIVKFWDDIKDIKNQVHVKLSEYNRKEDLIGWIKGSNAINGGEIAEQMAKLMKENEEMRQRLSGEGNGSSNTLSFAEQYQFLKKQILGPDDILGDHYKTFLALIKIWEPSDSPTLLHLMWYMQWNEDETRYFAPDQVKKLVKYGLYDEIPDKYHFFKYTLSLIGKTFIQRLILTNQYPEAEKFVYPYNPFTEKNKA
jgi:Domain of unknown function (DUF4062)